MQEQDRAPFALVDVVDADAAVVEPVRPVWKELFRKVVLDPHASGKYCASVIRTKLPHDKRAANRNVDIRTYVRYHPRVEELELAPGHVHQSWDRSGTTLVFLHPAEPLGTWWLTINGETSELPVEEGKIPALLDRIGFVPRGWASWAVPASAQRPGSGM